MLVHEELTRGPFLALFLSTGILGGLTNLTFSVLTRDLLIASIGASGATYGLVACYLMLQSQRQLGFSEYRFDYYTWIPLVYLLLSEGVLFWRGRNKGLIGGTKSRMASGGVDRLAHLGGLVGGAGAGYWLRRRAEAATVKVEGERSGEDDRGVMYVSTVSAPPGDGSKE
jgi:rhomboid-like protein